jgi:hypothetical protein
MRVYLGAVSIECDEAFTVTRFGDGRSVVADHAEQPGQAATAADMGISVEEMNRGHDLTHSLLAFWLGLPHSPTLHGVATGHHYEHHAIEEAAVLAVQLWAKVAGVDLIKTATRAD